MPRSVPIADQRTAGLVVMVTVQEKRELTRAAKERLTTVSSLIRTTVLLGLRDEARNEAKASCREFETA